MSGVYAALYILCLSAVCMADTATFTYKELNRGVLSTADFSVVRTQEGYHISICSTEGKKRIRQDMVCDSTFATLQWRYQSDQNTEISFRRNADRIELVGTLRGKPVIKNLTIDSRPWYQVVPLGLQTVSRDSAGKSKFWAVSLEQPAVLKAVCFHVAGTANAALPGHPEIPCRCFHMKIEGLLTQIWKGDYFIRQDDHTFMYYQGYSFGSKKPTGTIEAVAH
ncbi:MAG: hypothetical protein ABSF80_01280 [Chitinispirillaceae bacterium]